jgi:hypothetical protein
MRRAASTVFHAAGFSTAMASRLCHTVGHGSIVRAQPRIPMISIACLMLLAASTSVELADETYRIPPHYWRYMELGLRQRPALVNARFEVDEGPSRVRLALMTRDELERMRNGQPRSPLVVSPAGAAGRVIYEVAEAGDYVLVVENRAAEASVVHLRVMLDFAGTSTMHVTQISPLRRTVVVGLSLAFFLAIVSYSGRRLLRSFHRR